MTQTTPYQNKTKTGKGLVEYLMLQKPSSSAILASLLIASFLTATILPWITIIKSKINPPGYATTNKSIQNLE